MRNIVMAKKTKRVTKKRPIKYQLKQGVQLEPGYSGWGGYRPGAGRKKSPDSGVSHNVREALTKRDRALVTLRVAEGRPKLTTKVAMKTMTEALKLARKDDFEILEYRVQDQVVHLLVRADDRRAMGRGMGGLGSRMSRQLNRTWGTSGTVYADRYEDKVLRTTAAVNKAKREVGGKGTWKKVE